jgi:hypothetical protein
VPPLAVVPPVLVAPPVPVVPPLAVVPPVPTVPPVPGIGWLPVDVQPRHTNTLRVAGTRARRSQGEQLMAISPRDTAPL